MTPAATFGASLLAVLARPSTWPLALLGFLVRGGWLLVVAPIVVVPTPVGVANVVAPFLEDVAFGRRTDELATVIVAGFAAVAAVLFGGGLIAAIVEAEGVRQIADEEDLTWRSGRPAGRILAARLLAHVPLGLALSWAAIRVVTVAYRELTVPSDVALPLSWRIVAGAPEAIALVIATWLLGEIAGAMAARRIVRLGEGTRSALRNAARDIRTGPWRAIALGIGTSLGLVVVLTVTGLAAGATWGALGAALSIGDASPATTLLLVGFVALFAGGLVLISLTCAWRSAVWTIESGGTFGGGRWDPSG